METNNMPHANGNAFAPSTLPPIDTQMLELNLGALGDDMAECISFLTDTFLEDTPNFINAIRVGLDKADAYQVRFNVHTLKSSSATLGAMHLSELCLTLEKQAKLEDLSQGSQLLSAIEFEFERVQRRLREMQVAFLNGE
jgi:HPt (histidine-containing phosphotransfer) domain-containing protein